LSLKKASKKRSRAEFEGEESSSILREFEHEHELKSFYDEETGRIATSEVKQLKGKPFYVTLEVKELTSSLDLKEPVVLTMLN